MLGALRRGVREVRALRAQTNPMLISRSVRLGDVWRASQDLNLDTGSCNPVRILSATGLCVGFRNHGRVMQGQWG